MELTKLLNPMESFQNLNLPLEELVESRKDHTDILPNEIFYRIFSFLGPLQTLKCSRVNKTWHLLANDKILWKFFYKNHFKMIDTPEDIDYKTPLLRILKGLASTPKYFEIRPIFKSENFFMKGICNDQLLFFNEKENHFDLINPITLNSSSKIKIDGLEVKVHATAMGGNLLAVAYENAYSKANNSYFITIWDSNTATSIFTITCPKNNEIRLNLFLFKDSLFALSENKMIKWKIDPQLETKLFEISTNATTLEMLSKDLTLVGFSNGSVKILDNNNKWYNVFGIKNECQSKPFKVSKMKIFPENVLMVKFESESRAQNLDSHFDPFISYASFYKIKNIENKAFVAEKISSTLDESNLNRTFNSGIVKNNQIIYCINDKFNLSLYNTLVSKIKSYSIDTKTSFEILQILLPEKVVDLFWLNDSLYVYYENVLDFSLEQWTFYQFDDYIDIIIENYQSKKNANCDENILSAYLDSCFDLFYKEQMLDVICCNFINKNMISISKTDKFDFWNQSTPGDKYFALLFYRENKDTILNGTPEGRQALINKYFASSVQWDFVLPKK